jgi:Glucose / Sorbosone dehydrogenase
MYLPTARASLVVSLLALACAFPRVASAQLPALQSTVVVTGLSNPVAFVQDPTDPAVQFVVEQGGRIRVVRDGALLADDFLSLVGHVSAGDEQGLLGLAFAPDYATSRRFFVNFTNPAGHTIIARFLRSAADPVRADPSSRFDLMWPGGNRFVAQPAANHNGGDLAFGDDGYLYIPLGDGGGGNDPDHNAQNPMTLLGKMLRINVNVADSDPEGYDVPMDNPFVGNSAVLPEIWAFGFRNPYRFTIDLLARGGSGAIIIGDVGQSGWEEIDYEPSGAGGRNYGWRNREGAHDNVTTLPPAFLPLVDPIIEYDRSVGTTVIGGVVNRGTSLGTQFFARYFYADFGVGRVWSAKLTVNLTTREATASGITDHTAELGGALGNISALGIDASCRVHLVDYGGRILRIDSAAAPAVGTCPIGPDPFLSLGGGVFVNGGWLPPGDPSLGGGGSTGGTGCTTPQPASGWVCVNGGWVPPDHPLASGGGTTTPPPGGGTTPDPTTCGTPQPGLDWVCVGGGWVPPGHPLASGGGTTTPPPSTGGTPPPPSTACTTAQPGTGWVCVNGGWVPPDHPLASGGSTTPPPSNGTTTPPPSTACTTPQPAADWVCVNGGWVPPDHPLARGGT